MKSQITYVCLSISLPKYNCFPRPLALSLFHENSNLWFDTIWECRWCVVNGDGSKLSLIIIVMLMYRRLHWQLTNKSVGQTHAPRNRQNLDLPHGQPIINWKILCSYDNAKIKRQGRLNSASWSVAFPFPISITKGRPTGIFIAVSNNTECTHHIVIYTHISARRINSLIKSSVQRLNGKIIKVLPNNNNNNGGEVSFPFQSSLKVGPCALQLENAIA